MFNSYTTVNNTIKKNYSANIDVHEHKAPTDQTISLLRSMEEEARRNLIKRWDFTLGDNKLEGRIYLFQKPQDLVIIEVVHFFLNGQEYYIEGFLPFSMYNNYDAKKRFGEVMAKQIIKNLISKIG